MDTKLFYDIGRLSAVVDSVVPKMKSGILLFLTRHFVKSSNSGLSIIDLLEPEAYDKHKKILHRLVKYIKTMNDIIANKSVFDATVLQTLAKILGVNLDVGVVDDFDSLMNVLQQLEEKLSKETFSLLSVGAINLFFVCNGYIKYPIIDCFESVDLKSIDNGVKSSLGILMDAKRLINADKKCLVGYTKSVATVLDYAIMNPVFDIGMSVQSTGLSFATSSKVVSILEEKKILNKIYGNLRYRVYKYTKLLELFEV